MKKLLALLLIAALLAPCVLAEEIDVKSLSNEELKALYISVKEELMERKLWDESILPSGVYAVGKGLPEGTYECVAISSGNVCIYKNFDAFASDDYFIDWFHIEEGESFTMTLYGEICYLVKFNSVIRPFTGLIW